jgi:hypothetical protein
LPVSKRQQRRRLGCLADEAEASDPNGSRTVALMGPVPAEWESLRLAAKVADRAKAAEKLRPDFENRLKALGYSSLGIAHASGALSGPGTIADALEALERYRT